MIIEKSSVRKRNVNVKTAFPGGFGLQMGKMQE